MGFYRELPNDDFNGLSSLPCTFNVVKYKGWDPQAAHMGKKINICSIRGVLEGDVGIKITLDWILGK
jgi:hypothetical protein